MRLFMVVFESELNMGLSMCASAKDVIGGCWLMLMVELGTMLHRYFSGKKKKNKMMDQDLDTTANRIIEHRR